MDCLNCNQPLHEGTKESALYCTGKCKQAAYRKRAAARAAAQDWQPGDKAIAHEGFIVEIGKVKQGYAIVRVRYTVARVPDDKAAVWRKLPVSKLSHLKAIPL
jgi:hypothetical protein